MLIGKVIPIFRSNYKKIVTIHCVRFKSTAEPDKKAYSYSILFPKTDFPARPKSAARDDIQKVNKAFLHLLSSNLDCIAVFNSHLGTAGFGQHIPRYVLE